MTGTQTTALVFGATGTQGGAVARALLNRGAIVRAVTRNPHSTAALALRRLGAALVIADLDDPSSIHAAMRGCDTVFSVQQFRGIGPDGETRQGRAVIDAALRAQITHLVYSSAGGANRHSGIPHFESKAEIERHLAASGIPYTILRPAFFMTNYERQRDTILAGTLQLPLPAHRPLQQIAPEDIGHFAAQALSNPAAWAGRAIDLAGDELTMTQTARVFSRVTGTRITYRQRDPAGLSPDSAAMWAWLDHAGYTADLPRLRARNPALTDLGQYLTRHDWSPSRCAQPPDRSAR